MPHVFTSSITFWEHALSWPRAWKREVTWISGNFTLKIHCSTIALRMRCVAWSGKRNTWSPWTIGLKGQISWSNGPALREVHCIISRWRIMIRSSAAKLAILELNSPEVRGQLKMFNILESIFFVDFWIIRFSWNKPQFLVRFANFLKFSI